MVKKVLLVVVVLVVGFLGFVATRPSTYHVERTVSVAAPSDVAFTDVATLENFVRWSPWEKKDPKMKKQFSGPKEGVGQTYAWEGNDDIGQGEMKVVGMTPGSQVKETVHFIKPFDSTSSITMSVVPDGPNSKVTWAMDGDANFMAKMMGVFMPMDKMIGPDFEAGLKNLDTLAVADAKKAADAKAAAAAAAAIPPPPPVTEGAAPSPGTPAAPAAPAKG